MSEEQISGIRLRRTRAEGDQLVAEYEASGLSRQEFCRKQAVSLSTLNRYRKRRSPGEPASDGRWVRVELFGANQADGSGPGNELGVVLPGGRLIEVKRGFDADTLGQLEQA